jgi:hypothetical protein
MHRAASRPLGFWWLCAPELPRGSAEWLSPVRYPVGCGESKCETHVLGKCFNYPGKRPQTVWMEWEDNVL